MLMAFYILRKKVYFNKKFLHVISICDEAAIDSEALCIFTCSLLLIKFKSYEYFSCLCFRPRFIIYYIRKASNLHRLFTFISHWSQATFMFLLVDTYIYIYIYIHICMYIYIYIYI